MTILFTDLAQKLRWQLTDGSEFLWRCWGDTCRYADFRWCGWHISAIFNTNTGEVCEINGEPEFGWQTDRKPWRWIADDRVDAYLAECKRRGIGPWVAWDDVEYQRLHTEGDVWQFFADTENQVWNKITENTDEE
jgi:hypothetical protein